MQQLILPEHYHPDMDIKETEVAIKFVKDYFERRLAEVQMCIRDRYSINKNKIFFSKGSILFYTKSIPLVLESLYF